MRIAVYPATQGRSIIRPNNEHAHGLTAGHPARRAAERRIDRRFGAGEAAAIGAGYLVEARVGIASSDGSGRKGTP
jgi:hypothetical protein